VACSDSADIDNGMLVCLQVSLNLKCAASQDHPILLLCLSVLQPANADLCMHWLLKLYAQEYDSFARVWLASHNWAAHLLEQTYTNKDTFSERCFDDCPMHTNRMSV